MKKPYIYILMLLLCAGLSYSAEAQRILLLQKNGGLKNFKYFVGNAITIKTKSGVKVEGIIHEITDSSIYVNWDYEIMLNDMDRILKHRWGYGLLSKVTRIAGAGYFLLDVTNNIITGNPTIVNEQTAWISAGLIAFSYAIVPLHYRRMKIGEKWRVQVLNMSFGGEELNPFLR